MDMSPHTGVRLACSCLPPKGHENIPIIKQVWVFTSCLGEDHTAGRPGAVSKRKFRGRGLVIGLRFVLSDLGQA